MKISSKLRDIFIQIRESANDPNNYHPEYKDQADYAFLTALCDCGRTDNGHEEGCQWRKFNRFFSDLHIQLNFYYKKAVDHRKDDSVISFLAHNGGEVYIEHFEAVFDFDSVHSLTDHEYAEVLVNESTEDIVSIRLTEKGWLEFSHKGYH